VKILTKSYILGVKRKLFESTFQQKKNQGIWSSLERVMVKLVSKGQSCS